MRRLQPGIAVFCILLLFAPALPAQYIQERNSGMFGMYKAREVPPVDLANSNRLEQLLRAGNIYLSLQDAIALALENNLDIQIQRYNKPLQEASLLRAQAGGPLRGIPTSLQSATTDVLNQITGGVIGTGGGGQVSLGSGSGGTIITATGTNVPQLDPSFFALGYWQHQTALNANQVTTGTATLINRNDAYQMGFQKSFLTGTNLSLGWNGSKTTSNSPYLFLNPFINGSMNLTLTQSLLKGFVFHPNTRFIRIAKNNVRANDLIFKSQVINTVTAVVSGYWTLVSDIENVKVKEQALALAQKLLNDNKKQVEIGTLAPIEIVRAEAEVATRQQELVTARTAVLQQETGLKNALSRTGIASASVADAHIIPTDRITVPASEPVTPIQDLIATAMQNRPEVRQSQINIESTRIGLSGPKSELLPDLGLYANFTNNGLTGTPAIVSIPDQAGGSITPVGSVQPVFVGGFGSNLGQLFSRKFPNYALGIQLNIPLRNRSAQGDYAIDMLQLRQQELQQQRTFNQIRVDVQNALIGVQQASAAYAAAVKARELAQQTLDAEQKKYALGASTIFMVIQYQRDLASASSVEVTAASNYAKAKVNLQAATGTTLDDYNVSIAEAEKGRISRPPSALPVTQP